MIPVFEKRAAEARVDVDTYLKQQGAGNPMRRMGMPEDIVGAIFLASPASDFMTGNILYPDGGLTYRLIKQKQRWLTKRHPFFLTHIYILSSMGSHTSKYPVTLLSSTTLHARLPKAQSEMT